ncbi:unnamed protein product [Notodromas monacha]|uniref:Uncharacterized protein n=1 Tax=Notodromas monacha TaxID=399045 RepID=A0A7R9GEY1_9CRUS|nr:unnamed protein product [Notodromas monacha]CAG0920215.1 unnamed protein product [Notodromas monacha]
MTNLEYPIPFYRVDREMEPVCHGSRKAQEETSSLHQANFVTPGMLSLTAEDCGGTNATSRKHHEHRTCTKSVHKVVFLFCSLTLAIIIACIVFVEMKQTGDWEETSRRYHGEVGVNIQQLATHTHTHQENLAHPDY